MNLLPTFDLGHLTFGSVSLALACLLTGYLTSLSMTPPNPNPETKPDVDDRLRGVLTDRTIRNRRLLYNGLSVYHAVMVLVLAAATAKEPTSASNDGTVLCPWPENLNRGLLFTWSPYLAIALGLVCLVGAPLRLAAYGALGRNFTFHLQKPSELNTRGLYRYMQHPSYTGNVLVRGGCFVVFLRWDGVMGCWMPPTARAWLDGFGWTVYVFMLVVMEIGRAHV